MWSKFMPYTADEGGGKEDRRPRGDLFDLFVLGVAGFGQALDFVILRLPDQRGLDGQDGLVELHHALEVLPLTVGHAADPVEPVREVGHQSSLVCRDAGQGGHSFVDGAAQRAHGAHGEQPVAGPEQIVGNSSGSPTCPPVTRCSSLHTSLVTVST